MFHDGCVSIKSLLTAAILNLANSARNGHAEWVNGLVALGTRARRKRRAPAGGVLQTAELG
jgi:hypothetical protein